MKTCAPLLFLLNLSVASASNFTGKDLLTYFGSTCPSQGEWTKLVLNDSEALISVLTNIKNDPDCVTAAGAIAQLNNLSSKITSLENNNYIKINIEKLKAKELELVNQLSNTTDVNIQREINQALRNTQTESASLIAEQSAKEQLNGTNIQDVASQIVLSTNSLYKSISNNEKCLDKNPRVLSTVTSLVSSIGGALTMVNPALGIGLSATSDFIGNTVEGVRMRKLNRNIRKVADGALIDAGFKCALESLSNRWCELSDAKKFLEFKARYSRNTQEGFLTAIRIYDRKLPALLNWLGKVRSGAPASTGADAERHRLVYYRQQLVQSARSVGDGSYGEARPRFDLAANDRERYTIVRQLIIKLAGTYCGGASGTMSISTDGHPLFDVHSPGYAPYYLIGLDRIPRENGFEISFCNFDPFTQWPTGTFSPSIDDVHRRYNTWVEAGAKLVGQEMTLVLQPDSLGVLSSSLEKTGNKWKVSPKAALDDTLGFLRSNYPPKFMASSFKKIYDDTISRLHNISGQLEDALIDDRISPKNALEAIYKEASLQYGVVVFQSRLEMTVRLSIDEYFRVNNTEDQNIASQLLAAESYLEVLNKVTGRDNDSLMMMDIQNGMAASMNNMRNFVDAFANNIDQVLEQNFKKSKDGDVTKTQVYHDSLAKFCVLLSSMPEWHDKIDADYCEGRFIPSLYQGGPNSRVISSDYLKKSFQERSCGYRDYIRQSKIYQEWGIRF